MNPDFLYYPCWIDLFLSDLQTVYFQSHYSVGLYSAPDLCFPDFDQTNPAALAVVFLIHQAASVQCLYFSLLLCFQG